MAHTMARLKIDPFLSKLDLLKNPDESRLISGQRQRHNPLASSAMRILVIDLSHDGKVS